MEVKNMTNDVFGLRVDEDDDDWGKDDADTDEE